MRVERDTMGEVLVPDEALWGAQTQRSLGNFPIGSDRMPDALIAALAQVKRAAATANCELGRLSARDAELICAASDEVLAGKHANQFPLVVWQTGSGTQTNMNMNEVLANRGNQLAQEKCLHPNDTVNMSQSSNDVFPTAMHVAAVLLLQCELIPALSALEQTFARLEQTYADVVKGARTHLQDAVPITFGQEVSGWRGLVEAARSHVGAALPALYELPLGGTAVGTGLNAPQGFAEAAVRELAAATGAPFVSAPNKFSVMSGKDALVFAHGALKATAANLMKIANDVRWLASGPRLGLGEITIPANEPGSSIMPGKVNPTQCEALTMVATRVMGNDTTIGIAASQGNFQLNVFMPVIAHAFIESATLLSDAINSFNERCAAGIVADRERMRYNLHNSLMLVTCLNPLIGYDGAARVAKHAYATGVSLRQACLELELLTPEQFDEVFKPEEMV